MLKKLPFLTIILATIFANANLTNEPFCQMVENEGVVDIYDGYNNLECELTKEEFDKRLEDLKVYVLEENDSNRTFESNEYRRKLYACPK